MTLPALSLTHPNGLVLIACLLIALWSTELQGCLGDGSPSCLTVGGIWEWTAFSSLCLPSLSRASSSSDCCRLLPKLTGAVFREVSQWFLPFLCFYIDGLCGECSLLLFSSSRLYKMSVMKQIGHYRRFAPQPLGFRAILCMSYCPVLAPIPLATEGNDSEKLCR